MSVSKSQQSLSYGQPVSEGDFSPRVRELDDDDPCEFECDNGLSGWLPAGDYFVPCLCNVDVRGLFV